MGPINNNYLESAFDQIKWGDQGVGDTAWEETAKAAVSIVGAAAELAGVLFNSCSCYKLSIAKKKNTVQVQTFSSWNTNKKFITTNDIIAEDGRWKFLFGVIFFFVISRYYFFLD